MIFRSRHKKNEAAFTLIELVLTISLLGVLSAIGITMFTGSVDESRYDTTVQEMRQITNALVGDPNDKKGGARSNFGYLGDLGAIPAASNGLNALTTKPSTASAWAVNNSARIAAGWNGPYISSGVNGQDPLKDAWGRNYIYTNGANANITSYGADGAAGGTGFNQDIEMPIPTNLQTATVYGFLSTAGAPFSAAAQVEINFPNGNGTLTSTLVNIAAGSQGQFQFTNIPLGYRSISIYIPNKNSATQTMGPIPITVDTNNYLVPTTLTDTNPGGGAGSGGSGTGTGSCTNPIHAATLSVNAGSSFGSQISFSLDINSNISITAVKVSVPSAAALSEIHFDGTRYRCNRNRSFSPCPASNGNTATLSQVMNLNSGNRSVQLNFKDNVNSDSSATLELTYTSGCDIINVSGLL